MSVRATSRFGLGPSALPFVLSLFLLAPATATADWPGWRGAKRNGEVTILAPKQWPRSLKKEWSVKVGVGHASPITASGRIFQFSRLDEKETMTCLDPAGKIVWRKQYSAPYQMNNAALNHGKGPKSTPVIADGRVFSLGISGILSCWQASDGKLLWQREFSNEFDKTSPLYGAATSPLVVGDWVLVHVGGHDSGALMAFQCRDGQTAWAWRDDGPSYASPIAARLGGVTQLVTQSQKQCLALDQRGDLLWSIPFETDYSQNSVTPLVARSLLVVSGYGKGVSAYRIAKQGRMLAPSEAWSTRVASMYMSSPVAHRDKLFCYSQLKKGQLVCLDADDGKLIWAGPPRQGENAALLLAAPWLFALTTEGKLIVCRADADKYDEVRRYPVSDSPTWAHPVMDGRQLLIKNLDTLTKWSTSSGE